MATSFFYCCQGQATLSSGVILASARQDLSLDLQSQRLKYMEDKQRRLSFVEEISIRTETDRFEINRQQYLARVSVNGWGEMHHINEMHAAELTAEQKMQRVYLHEALVDRYQAIASFQQVLRELSLQKDLLLVYEDKVNVLKKMAALNVKADLDELIKVEYDVDEQSLKINEFEDQVDQLRQWIGILADTAAGDWQLDTVNFIAPAQIELIVDQLPDSISQNPTLEQKQNKIEQIDAAYSLEKAKSNQMLDFLQVRYAGRPNDPFEQDLAFGISLLIPYKGTSKVKMGELLIDKNNADQNAQLYQNELTRQMTLARQKVKALSQRYRLAQQQWQDSQARFTLEQSAISQSEGPLTLLDAKEMQLKRQMTLLEIRRDMLEQYLKILDWSGFLSAAPPVNYLSANLDTY